MVKNPPAMWETWAWSLGWDDPLEKGKTAHSCILAWRFPWTTVHGVTMSQTWLSDFRFASLLISAAGYHLTFIHHSGLFLLSFLKTICFQIYLEGLLFALRKQRLREAKWFDQTHRTRENLKQILTSASPFKPFLFSQHFSRPRSIHFNPFCLTVLNLLIRDDYLRHSWRKWLVCFEVLANPVQNSDLVVPRIPPGSKIFSISSRAFTTFL